MKTEQPIRHEKKCWTHTRRTAAKRIFQCVLCLLTGFISFTLSAQPVVGSFTPASGPAGTSITITGSGFSPDPAGNAVFFGAVRAQVSAATATTLTVTVPAGATYQPVSVTSNALTGYAAAPFLVTFPDGTSILQNPDNTQNSFAQRIDSTTGLHPNAVVAMDFDGDGKPDLATPNFYQVTGEPASVSVLRNTASGGAFSFAPRQDFTTGAYTIALAAGDLNGDGKPDMVSSSLQDQTISIFKNTSTSGSIAFAPRVDIATRLSPNAVAINDIDGDGRPDIVVGNFSVSSANHISVYRNTSMAGNISFTAPVDVFLSTLVSMLVTADLDGDRKPDLVTTQDQSSYLAVLRNTSTPGTISFATQLNFSIASGPGAIAAGDLDSDGKPDIAVANYTAGTISLLRNTSTGAAISFAARIDRGCGAYPTGITIGEINGDARPDLITSCGAPVLMQNFSTPGTIAFGANVILYGLTTNTAAIADLTGDGKADLACSYVVGSRVSLFRNKSNEPTVRSFTPTPAAAGTTITVTGINFLQATAVSFGGVPARSFTVTDAATIRAVVDTGASGDVSVTNAYGTGSSRGFVYAGPPVIRAFSPRAAAQGATVIITGANFTGATAVSFGGVAAQSFTVTSPSAIAAVVNQGASGSVAVTTPYGKAELAGFAVLPAITSFYPQQAGTGTVVSISGSNFTGITSVSFGGVAAASFTILSATSMTATVGSGASGDLSITTASGTTSSPGFVYLSSPSISAFTPTAAGTDTTVTITGNYFTDVQAVSFGGVAAASFRVVSSTTITAVVGRGASGAVAVTTVAGKGTLAGFTYLPVPYIASFSPLTSGPGAVLTIRGNNFTTTSSITLGDVPVASFRVDSDTSITAIVGTGASGRIDLRSRGGITYRDGFTFTSLPVINSLLPVSGPIGTVVQIRGANFSANPAENIVYFGAVRAVVTNAAGNLLTVAVPPGASCKPVSVNTNGRTCFSTNPFVVTFANSGSFAAGSFAGRMDLVTGNTPLMDQLTSNTSLGLASGDFDGDGKPDLAVANTVAGSVSLFRNTSTTASLSFASRMDMAAGKKPYYVTTADLDGDGKLDLIVLNGYYSDWGACFFKNTSTPGSISFGPRQDFVPNAHGSAIAVVDFTNDGKLDLLIVNNVWGGFYRGSTVTVLNNTSTGGAISFGEPVRYFVTGVIGDNEAPLSMVVRDMDEDGKPDVVLGYQGSNFRNVITILKNRSFPQHPFDIVDMEGSIYQQDRYVSVADFDNDGRPDIICRGTVFRNQGNLSFNAITIGAIEPFPDVADLNGDGKIDYVRTGIADSSVYVLENATPGPNIYLNPAVRFSTGTSPSGILTGDLDGDGKPEIVTASSKYNRVSILKNTIRYAGPHITSFKPATGSPGTVIQITGSGFTGATAVSIGEVPVSSFSVNSPTAITAVVPAGVSGNVSVATPGGTISLAWFTIIPPPPVISSFSPARTGADSAITITGTNLSEVTAVRLGGTDVASYISVSPARIEAVVAKGASGAVSVTTLGGVASLAGFTFVPPPVISDFTPRTGGPGTVVTITGSNFADIREITFGGTAAASFTINSPTSITATVGAGASGTVRITALGGIAAAYPAEFAYIPIPVISSFAPAAAKTGSVVTITGLNFTGATAVSFGSTAAASFAVTSPTGITATVGAGESGAISVTTPDGTATKAGFVFDISTGITAVSAAVAGIHLYPNPTTGSVMLDSLQLQDKWQTLDIMGLDGKRLSTIDIRNRRTVLLSLQALPGGTYIAVLKRKRGIAVTVQIVKQ